MFSSSDRLVLYISKQSIALRTFDAQTQRLIDRGRIELGERSPFSGAPSTRYRSDVVKKMQQSIEKQHINNKHIICVFSADLAVQSVQYVKKTFPKDKIIDAGLLTELVETALDQSKIDTNGLYDAHILFSVVNGYAIRNIQGKRGSEVESVIMVSAITPKLKETIVDIISDVFPHARLEAMLFPSVALDIADCVRTSIPGIHMIVDSQTSELIAVSEMGTHGIISKEIHFGVQSILGTESAALTQSSIDLYMDGLVDERTSQNLEFKINQVAEHILQELESALGTTDEKNIYPHIHVFVPGLADKIWSLVLAKVAGVNKSHVHIDYIDDILVRVLTNPDLESHVLTFE